MLGEIISIGDELLIGQVVNTNASFIAEALNTAGIQIIRIVSVADDGKQLMDALNEAASRAEVVIMTGGLGPTRDDITKSVLCEYFQTHLAFNEEVFENIKRIFRGRGLTWNKLNRDQALVPEACIPLHNAHGTAPGMWFEKEGTVFISLPGVPLEMKKLITGTVVPKLRELFPEAEALVHHTVYTQGIGESALATRIESWENSLPSHMKLAYLPRAGMVRLRLSASGDNRIALSKEIRAKFKELDQLIPGELFGEDQENLERVIGNQLLKAGRTLSTAESCTGGYIAHLITRVPGSSGYFKGSIIAYSNEIKESILHVDEPLLIRYGAVSEEVVRSMAVGARNQLKTDYSIAVSGIAGPDGGSVEKPVGTIWIAIGTPDRVVSRKFLFGTHRQRNIERTALTALNMLRKELKS